MTHTSKNSKSTQYKGGAIDNGNETMHSKQNNPNTRTTIRTLELPNAPNMGLRNKMGFMGVM